MQPAALDEIDDDFKAPSHDDEGKASDNWKSVQTKKKFNKFVKITMCV